MNNNLTNNFLQPDSTNLIRGGTGYPYTPFELKLQLHGQERNPYTVSVKSGYKVSASISVDVPAYTEKSWTTAGTFSWTVPAGVTRIRVAVCGGGGGGSYTYRSEDHAYASAGNSSTFAGLIATGGGRADTDGPTNSSSLGQCHVGVGGSPNGRNGVGCQTWTYSAQTADGGAGWALNFNKQTGSYGNGGTMRKNANGYATLAGGGSGGYTTSYVNVNPSQVLSGTVGSAGSNISWGSKAGSHTAPTSGFVLIAYGQGIE